MYRVTLTGIHDTDRKILFYLDDEALVNAYSISHAMYNLCNDQFWFQKFVNTYHVHLNQYGFSGNDYKKLYKKLRKLSHKDILFYAAQHGYLALVKSMLNDFKVKIHVNQDQALRDAAEYGHPAVVKLLLDRGAKIHVLNDVALRLALENDHHLVVELLLDRGADIRAADYMLISSAQKGQLAIVKLLLDRGADIHTEDDAALISAAANGQLNVVKLLLERGADLHADDDAALRAAARMRQLAVMELLLAYGVDLHVDDDKALIIAAMNGQLAVVEWLLDHDAKIHEKALILSAMNGQFAVVELLWDRDAKIHVNGEIALRAAAENGHIIVVKFLLEHGVDLDVIKGSQNLPPEIELFLANCQSLTKKGEPCKNKKITNSNYCRIHQQ